MEATTKAVEKASTESDQLAQATATAQVIELTVEQLGEVGGGVAYVLI